MSPSSTTSSYLYDPANPWNTGAPGVRRAAGPRQGRDGTASCMPVTSGQTRHLRLPAKQRIRVPPPCSFSRHGAAGPPPTSRFTRARQGARHRPGARIRRERVTWASRPSGERDRPGRHARVRVRPSGDPSQRLTIYANAAFAANRAVAGRRGPLTGPLGAGRRACSDDGDRLRGASGKPVITSARQAGACFPGAGATASALRPVAAEWPQ